MMWPQRKVYDIEKITRQNQKSPVTLCNLGVGATFGESILHDLPRDSTVVTKTTCELLRVEQQDLGGFGRSIQPTTQTSPVRRANSPDHPNPALAITEVPSPAISRIGWALRVLLLSDSSTCLKDRKVSGKLIRKCALGTELVDWLMNLSVIVHTRTQAVGMWQAILEEGVLSHVNKEQPFKDKCFLYRFKVDEDGTGCQPTSDEQNAANEHVREALGTLLHRGSDATLRMILRKPSHERTQEELELVFEELLHIAALSHLSTSIKREWASIIVFEAHAYAGTIQCVQMDSWATETFYSHFPSYSQQPTRTEELARERQHDYQTFLSHVTPRKGTASSKIHNRNISTDSHGKKQKIATTSDVFVSTESSIEFDTNSHNNNRNHFVRELEKMDLPGILNEDTINLRNQQSAEEKRLKSIQYQQELMAQIEQKMLEREKRKAREQEEVERSLRKMEEQLKTVRLQDELEIQRQTRARERRLINVEVNKPIMNSQHIKQPATVRSEQFEPNVYTFRSYDERKAQSERAGKENPSINSNDKEIYNFFTNSAQNHNNQLKDIRYSHYFDFDESSENEVQPVGTYNTYPSKNKCHHQDSRQPICSFCKHKRFLVRNQEDNISNGYVCDTCENEPICLNCRKEICVRCKRPTKADEPYSMVPGHQPKQRNIIKVPPFPKRQTELKPVKVNTELYQPILINDDESLSDCTDHKPYSFNIDESSVFHPSKSRLNRRLSGSIRNGEVSIQPDSFDELKRITEEKLSKLSKNYGPIRAKKPNETPHLRENTKQLIDFAKELERSDQNIFRHIEPKNNYPAKQIFQNSDTNTSTLTQVGAIKQHIRMDKLNF